MNYCFHEKEKNDNAGRRFGIRISVLLSIASTFLFHLLRFCLISIRFFSRLLYSNSCFKAREGLMVGRENQTKMNEE